jgi:alkanesulfonate monooxygenase SsuD/methylene tetrahydromethanopterin reductase-like flavin-dependent oxidoreductase (luciferase family)
MQFGWLTLAHSPSPDADQAGIFEQLDQACLAESLGFDEIWLTEHNFTGESVYCDPIPFAAALAMRTSRVRIGFAVIQMTLRHPVRLATQLSLLDNLCNGRLDVGIGRGTIYNEYEFMGFGLRSGDARERMNEALDVLTRCWTGTPFHHQGKYFDVRVPELRPAPVQTPHPPLWHSAASPGSFRACGEQGALLMTLRVPLALIGERLGQYREGLVSRGLDDAKQNALVKKAAIWRWVYVGESRAEAEDQLSAALIETRRHMVHAREDLNPADFRVDAALLNPWTDPHCSDEEGLAFALGSGALIGTARDVTEQVAAMRDAGCGHILCQMSFGYLGHDRITASMRRFAELVMPRFR